MVPDHLYADVCDFIENTHLGARVVYYRIKQRQNYFPISPESDSLLSKVEIKPDSEHYQWLQSQLQQRFDYSCCEHLDDFRRSEKALSLQGQIKSGRFRHEKDDRHNIQDKSRYVLGWSNREKIDLLSARLDNLEQQQKALKTELSQFKNEKDRLISQSRNALNLADFNFTFSQINWPYYSDKVAQLQLEKQTLESASDVLKNLQQALQEHQQKFKDNEAALNRHYSEKGATETEIASDENSLNENKSLFESLPETARTDTFVSLDAIYKQHIKPTQIRVNMLHNLSIQLRSKVNENISNLEAKRTRKLNQMISAMGEFASAFPNEVTELDKSAEALPEYQQLLKQLTDEDFPRHEGRFKEMLNRDTIRAMALFRSHLDRQDESIAARIRLINQSLHELDYQAGTYIEIDSISSADVDIRDFKVRLKQCVELSTDDNLYSEEKFERVKDLIEQMRNQPKWTEKVVDVRYWYLFNVVERYREDNSEKECYSDSGGKSGGQKEKLAYSILAAAILLQYGLLDNAKRRFNLVVIDEAFARGSKDSTRFGLELFEKLGLQLILVTPMQKLDVIENYVQNVHFVDQKNNRSMLLNMTIDAYREKLEQNKKLQQYARMLELQ
ncbi:ATP-binding protein [Catenovulum adriaticum]|uniref:Exonuclease SbcCD C subunit n=1 Tax=Catenovulum adriaticum TaxID=2984846 RepID=A0ABY7AP10_9ALTE|nr:SbcC/MukB-like Walker B domain-containing protein [Catenovulum sp. TS8]WAJ70396.1 hypothetical protein OLW01_00845 [Catenovulum sp. TS8]